MRIKNVFVHTSQALLEAGLISILIVGLIAGTALAAKGGGGGGGHSTATGTFSLVIHDTNNDGSPNYRESVTFDVSSTAAYPMVNLTCYQNNDWVTNQTVGFYSGWPWSQDFPLSSWKWVPGEADCTATLYYQTKRAD